MKKLTIAAGVVCAAGIILGPQMLGQRVEAQNQYLLHLINQNPFYEASWEQYEKGWFSTKGILAIKLTFPGIDTHQILALQSNAGQSPAIQAERAPSETGLPEETANMSLGTSLLAGEETEIKAKFTVDIQHGPVLLQDGFGIGLAAWDAHLISTEGMKEILDWDQTQALYRSRGTADLVGNLKFEDVISVFDINSADQSGTFTFNGYVASGELNSGHLVYKGTSKGLEGGSSTGERFALNDLKVDLMLDINDLESIMRGDLYDMEGEFSVASIIAKGESEFALEDITMMVSSKVNEDNTLADIGVGYGVGKFHADGLELTDAALDITLANYSAEFNRRYMKAFSEDIYANFELLDAQQNLEKLMLEALPLLLSEDPAFRVDSLRFTLPEGSFKSEATLQLSGVKQLPANPADMAFWLQHTTFSISASADKALAEKIASTTAKKQIMANSQVQMTEAQAHQAAAQQASMMLEMFGQQGLLVQKEKQYRFDFIFENGKALLNGQESPIPLGALLGQ